MTVNKKLLSLLQFAIGFAILAYLFVGMKDRADLLHAVRTALNHWPLLAAGFATFLVCLILCAIRWNLLLKAQGLRLPFRRVLSVFFIGHFFNAFLFGVTGGDVVKAYFVTMETPDKKTEAATTVFVDRIIGVLALIILTGVIMAARFRFFMAHSQTRIVMVFNLLLLAVTAVGMLIVFRRNVFERYAFFRRIEQRTALGAVIAKVYSAFHSSLSQRGVLVRTLLLSSVNHVTYVVAIFFLGGALDVNLPFIDYLTVFPIITAISALPITPGGLGTREAMSKWLLGVLAVPATRAVSLSLLSYGVVLAWSLAGGIVYLNYALRKGRRAPSPADPTPNA